MLIIGKNLDGITKQFNICPANLVEEFSLKIRLNRQIRKMLPAQNASNSILYGHPINDKVIYAPLEECGQNLELRPQEKVLACSEETYNMPKGFFGLIQTKGTLARLFVSATCNDGQVEPGYTGRLTLELINFSNFQIDLPIGSEVAQLYVFQCSGESEKPYSGKYQSAQAPTLPKFN